ncbi:iron-enterobactin transporter membrane protein [Escherichia coli]|uniref:Iron-enterobactin transporter membrane protein n=1 Tax=Escherichia coli TaxID=562 RepID=A0A377B089_ECOLX|nr:iron-enterobactin transporter membrane protein [Escherichia coli]
MSGSVAVTRAIAVPGIAVITDYRDGIKPAHWGKITPRFRSAGGLLRHLPERRLHHRARRAAAAYLAGLLAGGALGLAGALMQTLTRNPLADPACLA